MRGLRGCVGAWVLRVQGLPDRGWGRPPQRDAECRSSPVPVTLARRVLSFPSPWPHMHFGPGSTRCWATVHRPPRNPRPTTWGTHTCAARDFPLAAKPHQLLHHLLGDLQVLVAVTGLGTEGCQGQAGLLGTEGCRGQLCPLQLWVWLGGFTDTNDTSLPISTRQGTPPPGSPP